MHRMIEFKILKNRAMEIADTLETLRQNIVACGNTLDIDTRIEAMEMYGEYLTLQDEVREIHSKIYKLSEEIINGLENLEEGI